jgi:hypothetical protein
MHPIRRFVLLAAMVPIDQIPGLTPFQQRVGSQWIVEIHGNQD